MRYFLLLLLVILIFYFFSRKRKQHTEIAFFTIINHIKKQIFNMELKTKEFVNSILGLVDHTTQQPIEATFSNVQLSSSDESVFTVTSDVNADGVLDVVGVNPGGATITVTADVSYTDGNTGEAITASKTASLDVTVSPAPPEAQTTDLVVSFSAPQQVPTTNEPVTEG